MPSEYKYRKADGSVVEADVQQSGPQAPGQGGPSHAEVQAGSGASPGVGHRRPGCSSASTPGPCCRTSHSGAGAPAHGAAGPGALPQKDRSTGSSEHLCPNHGGQRVGLWNLTLIICLGEQIIVTSDNLP